MSSRKFELTSENGTAQKTSAMKRFRPLLEVLETHSTQPSYSSD